MGFILKLIDFSNKAYWSIAESFILAAIISFAIFYAVKTIYRLLGKAIDEDVLLPKIIKTVLTPCLILGMVSVAGHVYGVFYKIN